MRLCFEKGIAKGTVSAPPSKSMAHRLLVCAAMAKGTSVLEDVSMCEDVLATMDCLRNLGAECRVEGTTVTVTGRDFSLPQAQS